MVEPPLDGSHASGATFELAECVSYHFHPVRLGVKRAPGYTGSASSLGARDFVLKSNPVFIATIDLKALGSRPLLADAHLLDL